MAKRVDIASAVPCRASSSTQTGAEVAPLGKPFSIQEFTPTESPVSLSAESRTSAENRRRPFARATRTSAEKRGGTRAETRTDAEGTRTSAEEKRARIARKSHLWRKRAHRRVGTRTDTEKSALDRRQTRTNTEETRTYTEGTRTNTERSRTYGERDCFRSSGGYSANERP